MVIVTDKAKFKLISLMNDENLDNSYFVRVGVKGSGCAGISYTLDFDNITNSEKDQVFEDNGIKIVCDNRSLLYIFGTELNFSDGLNGKGFEWNNPNASRVCGCGDSFSV